MEEVFGALGDRVSKLPEDLVLVHENRRINSMLSTARTLRIQNGSELGESKRYTDTAVR